MLKFFTRSAAFVLAVACPVLGYGQSFDAGNGQPFGLSSKSLSAPVFADIDGDGDLDAFTVATGMNAGRVFYHENTGSKSKPAFKEGESKPFGLKEKSLTAPTFADIDGDGDLDAFGVETGMSAGKPYCCENKGSASAPAFAEPVSKPFGLSSKSLSAYTFVDLDGDGDLDAFGVESGMSAGKIYYCKNTGTITAPVFAGEETKPFNLTEKSLSAPTFTDIDGDGDLDLFAVSSGMSGAGWIYCCINTGSRTAPAFKSPDEKPYGLDEKSLTAPMFADLTGDGKPEAFCVSAGMAGAGGIYMKRQR